MSVNVDVTGRSVGRNNLVLGSHVHWWMELWDNPTLQQQVRGAKLKVLRFFVRWEDHGPCVSWDEATKTGTWDWTEFDAMIQAIYDCGAEPLININLIDPTIRSGMLPPGMAINPVSHFPNADSYGAYCKAIAEHCRAKGYNIRYWELFNECHITWKYYPLADIYTPQNEAIWREIALAYNQAAAEIKRALPGSMIGDTSTSRKGWCEYLAENAVLVDHIGHHKYDSGTETWEYAADPQPLFELAVGGKGYEALMHPDILFTPEEAQDVFQQIRRVRPAFFVTETNLGLGWGADFDHRMHEAVGAVWLAEETRDFILRGLGISLWYELASPGDSAFGLVELWGDYTEYYPYFVSMLFGQHLARNDTLLETVSSDETRVSALAWNHGGRTKLLIINKTPEQTTAIIEGLTGEALVYRIDSSAMVIQEETVTMPSTITMDGYTVILLATPKLPIIFPRMREILYGFPCVAKIYDRIDEVRAKRQEEGLILGRG